MTLSSREVSVNHPELSWPTTPSPTEQVDGQRDDQHRGRTRVWPVVCVFATVRNEEKYLEAALDSVLSQQYPGQMRFVVSVGPSMTIPTALPLSARGVILASMSLRTHRG